jgi:hypothetical protein
METKKCCEKGHGCSIWKCIGWGILGVIGFIALMVLIGLAIVWLWNCLMPSLFNLPLINFWQAVGLAILARLLIGASHGGWHQKLGRKWHQKHGGCNCNGGCNCGSNSKCGGNCKCGDQSQGKNNAGCCNTDSNSRKWGYYDKFWEEEGEKSFNDYVARKENNQSNS